MADKNKNNVPDEIEEVASKLGAGKIASIVGLITVLGGSTAIMTKADEIIDWISAGRVAEAVAPYKEALVCYKTAAKLLEINDEDCLEIIEADHE